MRMILSVALALIVSMGMVVNVAASGGDVRLSTTINGQERKIYFPADSEAAIAYHRDVKPLLPTGRGKMSDAAIAAMDKWKAKYITPQADQFATTHQSTPSNSVKILTDDELKAYADKVFELVNAEREKAGLSLLERSDYLDKAANTRAMECAEVNSLYVNGAAHTRPDGSRWFTVLGISKNYNYGENSGQGKTTADKQMESWMKSEGHRANILKDDYTEMGIGCAISKQGEVFAVQIFYRP